MPFIRNLPGLRSLCKTLIIKTINTHEIKEFSHAYIGTVNVFQSSTDLIDKVLEMSIRQRLTGTNNLVKVSFHELLHEITRQNRDG